MCGRRRARRLWWVLDYKNGEIRRDSLKPVKRIAILGTALVVSGTVAWIWAQERPTFRIKVDMVVVSFTVTNSKGNYINGLKPSDIKITEDGIPQKINTFGEGNKPPLQIMEDGST